MKPDDDVMYYASVSRGNRPADFNTAAGVPTNLIPIREQTIWSYEAGTKISVFDDRLRANAAVFLVDWSNQVTRSEVLSTITGRPLNITSNGGSSETKGVELELTALLAEGWEGNFGASHVKAKYKKFASANCLSAFGNASCDGKNIQNTPPNKFTIGTTYRAPVSGDWVWFGHGDVEYRSSQYTDEIGFTKLGSFTIANLRTGVEREGLSLIAFVNNVTDEDTPGFATRFSDFTRAPTTFGYQLTLRRGREFGATATYSF
jgi:iron complex outermembrane recepter protein